MREILFRAKIIATKSKWVEGFYVHVPCGRFMCDEHMIQTIDADGRIGQLYNVYESTLGQFTGLFDKNGKKIFEGDVIKNEYLGGKCQFSKIIYNETMHRWEVENNYRCRGKLCHVIGSMEVIGNIHDNPEHLEVQHGNQ